MSSILKGNKLNVSVYGQSHSQSIGAIIDGLPAGIKIDEDFIIDFMSRRAPGNNKFATTRKEPDLPIIMSGVVDGITCGAPVAIRIDNTNTRSQDYENLKNLPRPSHSDYASYIKYNGFNDIAGGGQFSGRLTAPLCFAGGLCLQILKEKNVFVKAHIFSVKDVFDDRFDMTVNQSKEFEDPFFPLINESLKAKMQDTIEYARKNGDSVGGIIECAISGLPAGLGEPMFDGIENIISKNIFAVPAVKGIEFGSGFEGTQKYGSENNDDFIVVDDKVKTKTNNHGGILGGITSGMPVVFRVAIKPTPSIGREQQSVNLKTMKEEKLIVNGRHDPCIVPRAVPVIEAVTAISVLDLFL